MWLLSCHTPADFRECFTHTRHSPLLLSLRLAASWDISVGLEELCASDLPGAVPALLEAARAGNDLGAKGSPAQPLELSF